MNYKRRKSDNLMKKILTVFMNVCGVLGIIYGGLVWYKKQMIKSYDQGKTIINNVKSIQSLNSNLTTLSKNNNKQHEEIRKDVAIIKGSIDNIDGNIERLNEFILYSMGKEKNLVLKKKKSYLKSN